MTNGPETNVGGITADLTINDSEFNRKADEAKVKAQELGALSPEVKVDANVGPALAKLDAVTMAEHRLEAAQRAATNSASTAYIASLRLEEVEGKRGRTDLQVAVASEALARADRNAEAAETKLLLATTALNAAKAESVRKSAEDVAATDAETESVKRNSGAMQGRISGVQVLIGLAPLILAAAAPIGAAAIGLGVAFGVMAVSGVAAVAGIKDEMAKGTAVGQSYAAGLGDLKHDFDALEHTAAVGMLTAFKSAVGDLNIRMPFLNQLIGTSVDQLGNMGGIALRGVLNGLQAMNPLIVQSGAALSDFVGWLASFTSSNGFQSFIAYAMTNLPPTMHLIEGLVSLAGNILAAFAPLGPVVVGALSGLVDLLNSFPLPVLAGIVTSATLLAPALRLAFNPAIAAAIDTVAASIGLTGVMANLAVPVVGILTAAIAGIVVGTAAAAASTNSQKDATVAATQAAADYATALQQDNGVIGENVRLMAAKKLQDSGALDAAKQMGITLSTVTDAVTGNSTAMASVKERIQNVADAYSNAVASGRPIPQVLQDQVSALQVLYPQLGLTTDALGSAVKKSDELKLAATETTGAVSAQGDAAMALAAKQGISSTAYQAATTAQASAKQQADQTTASLYLQNDAAGLLKQAWDKLNGKTISAAQAQNAFDSSLVNMGDHISATGKKIIFTTTSIGDMSSASVALRGQLNGQVTSLEGVIEANGGLDKATAQSRQQYIDMRQQIIDNAVAHGVNRDAVTAYVDSLFTIPPVIKSQVEMDAEKAKADLLAIQQLMAGIQDKHIQVTTDYVANGKDTGIPNTTNTNNNPGIVQKFAHGGQVAYLASGGFPGKPQGTDTQAAWLTPGEIVMNTASVASLGAGNLLHANKTGQWPGGGSQQAPNVTVYVTNPFTGEQVQAVVASAANAAISGANHDVKYRRVGV